MNSSTSHAINIVIDVSILTSSSINICISTSLFGFIVYHLIKIRNSPNHVALLLTANMYSALMFSAISILEQYIHVLPKHLYSSSTLPNPISCQLAAYFQWISICGIYYSNSIQAIYRLCRIVFHQKQSLQSFKLYILLIIFQWIICFIFMMPTFFLGYYIYIIEDNICSNDITVVFSTAVNSTLAYFIPVSITTGCYIYTLIKMRQGNRNSLIHTMTQIQQISARRDLIVLVRICLLLALLLSIWIPITIAFFLYKRTGIKPWWAGQVQRFVFHLSTTSVSILLLVISPHIWTLWKRDNRRQPI